MPDMKKSFNDGVSSSKEPTNFIGCVAGWNCYESSSIYMTHLVRLERGGAVKFMYDAGKVWRYANCY